MRTRRVVGEIGRPGVGILAVLHCLAVAPAPAGAQDAPDQNNHTAVFLRSGVDARYLAMGGLGAAAADNVAAGYWNPAGLSFVRGFSVTGMTTSGLDFDRRHNYLAGAWGTERVALGLSWINAGTDDIPGASGSGASTGTFAFNENAILLSAAARAASAAFGVNAKLVTQDLGTAAPGGGDNTVLGYGVDLGVQIYPTQFARVGFMIQDLFGRVGSASGNADHTPANLRAGLALEPMDGFLVSAEVEKTRDDANIRFHLGGEYEVPLGTDLTGAVRFGSREGDLSGGFGLGFRSFRVDYAYVIEPQAFLNENHRVSLTLDLGARRQVMRAGGYEDRDADGIPDDQDACPDQAEDYDSYQDFDGCPDLDNDGDGIPDLQDQCPDEAEDMDGYQDTDGCPDPDNDGDGIPDVRDKCPDQPETVNGYQDDDGCPDEAAAIPPAFIDFASGSARLPGPGPYPVLDLVLTQLRQDPNLRLEIRGYTDSRGDAGANRRLSLLRAQAVRTWLVEQGADPGRLEVQGYGENDPVDSNDTSQGRARNRRIEFAPISP